MAASAGAGKTKVLTDRVLALLLKGNAPERILCLTFTKAAAAEMAIRLSQRLGEWAIADDVRLTQELEELTGSKPKPALLSAARRLFARLLDTPGGMRIDTIHAFCQSVLRRFPIEAGIAPHFTVLDERSAAEVLQQARAEVLAKPELAAALGEIAAHSGEGGFDQLIGEIVHQRAKLELLSADGLERLLARLRDLIGVAAGDTPENIVAQASRDFDDGMVLAAARSLMDSVKPSDRKRGEAIVGWLEAPAERAARFDAYAACYLTRQDEPRKIIYTKDFLRDEPQEAVTLDAEGARVMAAVTRCRAATVYAATAALMRVADALLHSYRRLKQQRAQLDYDDLILITRDLLRRHGVAPWVLFKLDGGLDHILIDEAQDTNPEQWQVIAGLAEEFFTGEGARTLDRTIFAVGDVKQSIFSFQGADRAEFDRMRGHFATKVRSAQKTLQQIDLDISFRSAPAVLQAVDAIFAREAAAAGVVPQGTRLDHRPHRIGMAGLVELWPPVDPEEEGAESAWDLALDRRPVSAPSTRLARALAIRIKAWLDGGEVLEARGRSVSAGDILVLVRRRNAFVPELIRALKELGVPVAGADRMRLSEQLAVEDLIALGRFLLLPEDELTLATVLKSPIFDWDDDLLYELARPRAGRSLWFELRRRAKERTEFARAAGELSELLAQADFVPPYELFAQVLGARGGRRAMLRRLGPDAADPLDEFLAAALAYQRIHAPSLQGFLAWLSAGEAEIKRDLDQRGRDEVRIMTVHGAKGLQAPIVILPDTLQAPGQLSKTLWTAEGLPLWSGRDGRAPALELAKGLAEQRRDEEYRRLLYVALTRAEDRLYVCGYNTKRPAPPGNWHDLVKAGLEACPGTQSFAFRAEGAEGWAGVGLRLESAQRAAAAETKPSERQSPPEIPEPPWLRRMPMPEPAPPRPLAPSRPAVPEPPAPSPLAAAGGDRFRRGRLVHRLLQTLPELAPAARAAAGRRYLGFSVHRLPAAEQESILVETLAVLERPDFAAVFGPRSRAEVPIVAVMDDHAITGQIDRIVVLEDRLLIVDYKTLRPAPADPASVPPAYLRQLAVYRAALQRVYPRHAIEAAILWTDGPILMPIPPALLHLSRVAGASLHGFGAGAIA